MTPEQVTAKDYKAIFYAGGHGAMWDFPENEALARIAAEIYENGGIVSAVCHGPAGLLNIKLKDGTSLIAGKRLDSFTNAEEIANHTQNIVPFMLQTALTERGAIFDSAQAFTDHTVRDGRLLTGQNPMSALSLGKLILEVLQTNNRE